MVGGMNLRFYIEFHGAVASVLNITEPPDADEKI